MDKAEEIRVELADALRQANLRYEAYLEQSPAPVRQEWPEFAAAFLLNEFGGVCMPIVQRTQAKRASEWIPVAESPLNALDI